MDAKPRAVLIDLSSLFWTAWMVNNENGPQQARSITLANVKRCVGEGNPLAAVCTDEGKSFRKTISPDYKATREKQPEAAYGELQKTKERLRADGYLLWGADGFEADDVIATATDMAVRAGHEVRVCSSDKDLMALLGPSVDVLRTHVWEVYNVARFTEKFKITPAQFTDFLALKGDTSDNVPGCKGIGDVRAAELIGKYGTIAKLYRALDAGETVATPANQKALTEQRAAVELSRRLVELNFDVPIDFEAIYAERKLQPLTGDLGDMDEPDAEFSGPKEDAPTAPVEADSASLPPVGSSPATTAMVPVTVEYERQLEPTSIGTAYKLAKGLVTSRLYSRFPNEEAIMAVIIRGREMGLGALTSLDSFHVIEGRPSPHAYLMIARAKADSDCEYLYCKHTDDKSATWVTKNRRNPEETSLTYTLEQAKASGLIQPAQEKTGRDGKKYWSKDNQWVVRPAEMVRKTCGVQLARMEYPASVMGLYAYEELGGNED